MCSPSPDHHSIKNCQFSTVKEIELRMTPGLLRLFLKRVGDLKGIRAIKSLSKYRNALADLP
ncbi:hypothetical protein F1880_008189 [Penicillium rolfsii]|nr:hypothetical protein F1880_008189 [Penicillium rolfsii]